MLVIGMHKLQKGLPKDIVFSEPKGSNSHSVNVANPAFATTIIASIALVAIGEHLISLCLTSEAFPQSACKVVID